MGFSVGKVFKKASHAVKKVGSIAGKEVKAQVKAAKNTAKNVVKTSGKTLKAASKGDIKGIGKSVKSGLSKQNSIRKENFHDTVKPISENKYTNMMAQLAASYFGGPAGAAAWGAASGYENSGGKWGSAALGGGLGYLGGKGMQNAGFTYGQDGMTNLMNGTLGSTSSIGNGLSGPGTAGYEGQGALGMDFGNGGISYLNADGGYSLANAGGFLSPGQDGAYNAARSLNNAAGDPIGQLGGDTPSNGGGTDWSSLLGQLGGGIADSIGTDKGAKAYQKTINQGMNWGKGQIANQNNYANQVPGQIAGYMPAVQGQVAYEEGTPNNPYTAQAGAYGQQLSDILSGKSDWKQDPGYQFRMQQGQQETERNAASRGYNMSGNIMAALQDRAQGTASQEYQNITGRLQGLQDQYANQDINAQGVSSGDRRNNANNRAGLINQGLVTQAGYRNNAGQLGGGILDMYNNKANSNALEESAPWLAGGSALRGSVSDPTAGRTTGSSSNGIGGAINTAGNLYGLYKSIFG